MRHERSIAFGFSLACGMLVIGGCGQTEPSDPGENAAASGDVEPTWTYTGIRGEVARLPDAFADFTVHHEHIPDFRDVRTGEIFVGPGGVTGMRAMVMPFPPAEGVDISGLAVGDLIEFDLAVWSSDSARGAAFEVAWIEKLPAGTELDFSDKPNVVLPNEPGGP